MVLLRSVVSLASCVNVVVADSDPRHGNIHVVTRGVDHGAQAILAVLYFRGWPVGTTLQHVCNTGGLKISEIHIRNSARLTEMRLPDSNNSSLRCIQRSKYTNQTKAYSFPTL